MKKSITSPKVAVRMPSKVHEITKIVAKEKHARAEGQAREVIPA